MRGPHTKTKGAHINPRPEEVWRVTRPDGGGGGKGPTKDLVELYRIQSC